MLVGVGVVSGSELGSGCEPRIDLPAGLLNIKTPCYPSYYIIFLH